MTTSISLNNMTPRQRITFAKEFVERLGADLKLDTPIVFDTTGEVEYDTITGTLIIPAFIETAIPRDATWVVADPDEANSIPSIRSNDVDFKGPISDADLKVFEPNIWTDGNYKTVAIKFVDYEAETDLIDAEAADCYKESDDYSSYWVVEGVVYQACTIFLDIFVQDAE